MVAKTRIVFGSNSIRKIARGVVLLLVCIFSFGEASSAVTPKECQHLILQTESWASEGRSAAVQVAFNKSSGKEGHLSLTDGYLSFYNPEDVPEVEALLKRGQSGVFQPLPKFVMDRFEFENASSSHTGDRSFLTERKDEIFLALLSNGEVFIILRSSGNTVLPVSNLQCFVGGFFDPGYYMTGFIHEENSTTLISLVVRNVSP